MRQLVAAGPFEHPTPEPPTSDLMPDRTSCSEKPLRRSCRALHEYGLGELPQGCHG